MMATKGRWMRVAAFAFPWPAVGCISLGSSEPDPRGAGGAPKSGGASSTGEERAIASRAHVGVADPFASQIFTAGGFGRSSGGGSDS